MKGMLVDRTLNYNEIIAFVTATSGPDGAAISPAEVEQALERLVDADIIETLWDDEGNIQSVLALVDGQTIWMRIA